MENNKAYLKNIHWVFFIAIAYSALVTFGQPWLLRQLEPRTTILILFSLQSSLMYGALGIATAKWKGVLIAWVAIMALQLANFILPSSSSLNVPVFFLFFFLSPVPLVVFIVLQAGWSKRILVVYPGILAVIMATSISANPRYQVFSLFRSIAFRSGSTLDVFSFISATAALVFSIIAICELLNYARGKNYTGKSTLLNLGNDYPKLNSLISFWALKVVLLLLLIRSTAPLNFFRSFADNKPMALFYLCISIVSVLSAAGAALFLTWYLRKFLLEYFITFNIPSKFLYWLSLLPVIGFIAFLIIQANTEKQERYHQKTATIGSFAASSAAAVTTLFFIGLFIRLLMQIGEGDPIFIVSLVISALLFIWLMTDKTGYYVSLVLMLLAVVILMAVGIKFGIAGEEISLPWGLLLFNLAQLIFIYPIYHFDNFLYIPAEIPEPELSSDYILSDLDPAQ